MNLTELEKEIRKEIKGFLEEHGCSEDCEIAKAHFKLESLTEFRKGLDDEILRGVWFASGKPSPHQTTKYKTCKKVIEELRRRVLG